VKKFTMIIGTPGCGKSFLANKLLLKNPNQVLLDDISRLLRVTHCGLRYFEVVAQFPEYNEFILSDPAFCEDSFRVRVMKELKEVFGEDEVVFDFIYFENDPDQCLQNVELRNDGRKVRKYIERLSKTYNIPEGVIPIKVWKPCNSY